MTGRRCVTPLGQQSAPPPPKATGERSRVNYLKTDSTRSTTLRCARRGMGHQGSARDVKVPPTISRL